MGVMLLVFSPCLYANVSDAWTLPNKWHRAAIGAAGMYVELILASLAVFVWWSTKPGLVHYLALNVMFVCSVSTLMFNANPLMRFDGYYILSDLLEIPNLRSKASRVLQAQLGAWLLGLKPQVDPFLPQRHRVLFGLFAVASGVYGWFVTASITWTLLKMFEPYGFKVVGLLLALVSIYAVLVLPLWRLGQWLLARERNEPVDKLRALISGSLMLALVLSLAWLPLPRYVTCSVLIEQRDAAAVYVDVPGELREVLAAPYTEVAAGQPIARLANVDLELELARLEGERAQTATRLEALRERSLVDDEAAQLVAHTEEALAGLDEQLAKKQTERERLLIVAPMSGILTPAAPRSEQEAEGRLAVWHGHPLEVRNVGARLETGAAIGLIGDARELTAVLMIDETEIDFVQPGQHVDLLLDELPGQRIATRIDRVSADELQFAPPALSARHGGALQTKTDPEGRERPVATIYQASAALANDRGLVISGTRGTARIWAGKETLGRRLWREACRTLAWEL
jgi:putative peptide zinc metalloprotease protein